MSELQIYHNGNDWVVGNSPEDAMKIWNEYIGDNWIDDLYGDADDFIGIPQSESFTIAQEDMPEREHNPEFATWSKGKRGLWRITAKAQEWADHNGRGWLCSMDY